MVTLKPILSQNNLDPAEFITSASSLVVWLIDTCSWPEELDDGQGLLHEADDVDEKPSMPNCWAIQSR